MDQIPPSEGFRWHDLDQTLVAPKLSKLAAEMQGAFFKDEAEISFEGRKRGNSGYFLPTFLDKQLERTDEWARRTYEIYCECWYEQGHCISPEFVRAVYTHGIFVIFHIRKGTIADHFARQAHRTGERLNQHCLASFVRRIDVLANTWLRDIEAQAKTLEHDSHELRLLAIAPTSPHDARQMILRCDSRLTEINVKIEAQKQALTLATANGAPVSSILQEIRKLSERKTSFEKLVKELRAHEIEADESGPSKLQVPRWKHSPSNNWTRSVVELRRGKLERKSGAINNAQRAQQKESGSSAYLPPLNRATEGLSIV